MTFFQYCHERELNPNIFPGVTLRELVDVEDIFEINVVMYVLELESSSSQTFSHRVPFVVLLLSPRTTFLQKNSIYQISFDQKFGEPELTQMRHEENGCEKL